MLTVLNARRPQWNDAAHTSLNLMVTFAESAETLGEIPFTASPIDCEAYGRDLFQRAVASEFGEIAEPSSGEMMRAALLTRSRLSSEATATITTLQATLFTLQDAVRLNMATESEAAALPIKQAEYDTWCAYRVMLSRIEEQAGYPADVTWPTPPGAEADSAAGLSPG